MKKIFAILVMTLLLSSCNLFNKDEWETEVDVPVEGIENSEDGGSEKVGDVSENWDSVDDALEDENAKEKMPESDLVEGDVLDWWSLEEGLPSEDTIDDAKTEEEVVKEFEEELDSLFKLLEWDE